MKLLISLFLLYPALIHAKVIVLSYPAQKLNYAVHLAQVLSQAHHIPSEFIELKQKNDPCKKIRTLMSWHLCIDSSGDLHEVTADPRFIDETLRIFL